MLKLWLIECINFKIDTNIKLLLKSENFEIENFVKKKMIEINSI